MKDEQSKEHTGNINKNSKLAPLHWRGAGGEVKNSLD